MIIRAWNVFLTAQCLFQHGSGGSLAHPELSRGGDDLPGRLAAKGPARRRFLKNLAYRYLPGRSLINFIWMYFFKLGFLDGRLGFRYCLLRSFYEYQVSLKLEELQDPEAPISQKYRDLR